MLSSAAHRLLKSNNVNQVTAYIKLKYDDFLVSQNVFQRAEQLSLPADRHDFAERLGQDMLQASLDAERRTKRYLQNWIAIHEPVLRASYRRAKRHVTADIKSIRQHFMLRLRI